MGVILAKHIYIYIYVTVSNPWGYRKLSSQLFFFIDGQSNGLG